MIGCSIALAVWTTVLLLWTLRKEKTRVVDGAVGEGERKQEGSVVEREDEVVGEKA